MSDSHRGSDGMVRELGTTWELRGNLVGIPANTLEEQHFENMAELFPRLPIPKGRETGTGDSKDATRRDNNATGIHDGRSEPMNIGKRVGLRTQKHAILSAIHVRSCETQCSMRFAGWLSHSGTI